VSLRSFIGGEKTKKKMENILTKKFRKFSFAPTSIFLVSQWRRVHLLVSHINDSETSHLAAEVSKSLSESSAG